MQPKVCVLKTDGINCDEETVQAFRLAGAEAQIVHVNTLRADPKSLLGYQVLTVPGGFSYGDDVVSGKILATELTSFFFHELSEFVDRGGLVLGICNGFQVLAQAGLLPVPNLGMPQVALMHNVSGRFECRWVELVPQSSPCVFTRGLEEPLTLPVANGEGNVWAPALQLEALEQGCLAPLRYSNGGQPTQEYPHNPSGSQNAIAGMCDPTGRIFGLMPHPERFVMDTQHPNWRRQSLGKPHGRVFFENAVKFVATA